MTPAWTVTNLAFSQDGTTLAYSVNGPPPVVVYSRRLDDTDARPLAIAKGLTNPLYSPDDRWLAMTDYSKESLVKFPLTGGAPVRLGPRRWPSTANGDGTATSTGATRSHPASSARRPTAGMPKLSRPSTSTRRSAITGSRDYCRAAKP